MIDLGDELGFAAIRFFRFRERFDELPLGLLEDRDRFLVTRVDLPNLFGQRAILILER